jgi:hypothetical protein
MQNAPPGIQQVHPARNSFGRPATKSNVVVAVNTDIPHVFENRVLRRIFEPKRD